MSPKVTDISNWRATLSARNSAIDTTLIITNDFLFIVDRVFVLNEFNILYHIELILSTICLAEKVRRLFRILKDFLYS